MYENNSIPQQFLQFVRSNPHVNFVHVPHQQEDKWVWTPVTRQQSLEQVAGLAKRLQSLGVREGSVVAVWSNTRAEWCWIDVAVMSLGAVVVGIYPTVTKEVVLEQMGDSQAMMLIVEKESMYQRWEDDFDQLEDLVHVLSIEESQEIVPLRAAQIDLEWFAKEVAQVSGEQVATIVYTSGSTGKSKGVPLTHANFLSNLFATKEVLPLPTGSRSIVCLPMAHSLQKFVVYRSFVEDMEGYFAPSLQDIPATIQAAKPTILIAVPRMLEKIQQTVYQRARQKSSVAEKIVRWGIEVGWSSAYQQRIKGKVSRVIRLQYAIANNVILSTIRENLGGALQTIISGGAPLQDSTAQFFVALGIQVVEGWGLSESCAPATLNVDGIAKLGSVGKALPNMSLRLDSKGEILLRGTGVFAGYHNQDPQEAFVEGDQHTGYFATGDLGHIDADGYLYIVGRCKDIIVTAGGKNIAPRRIQEKIIGGLIHHCVVVGDALPYLSALIALDAEALRAYAQEKLWEGDMGNWVRHPEIVSMVAQTIEKANTELAGFEQIKYHYILPTPLTEEDGLLTSTQKPRNQEITKRYGQEWRRFYGQ